MSIQLWIWLDPDMIPITTCVKKRIHTQNFQDSSFGNQVRVGTLMKSPWKGFPTPKVEAYCWTVCQFKDSRDGQSHSHGNSAFKCLFPMSAHCSLNMGTSRIITILTHLMGIRSTSKREGNAEVNKNSCVVIVENKEWKNLQNIHGSRRRKSLTQ